MALSRIIYLLTLARDNVRANMGINAISVGIISLAMLLFSGFLLTMVNLSRIVEHWGERIQISVYLEDGITEAEIEQLRHRLLNMPEVAEIDYVSKEEALALFREMLAGQADLLEGLEENPLPASLEIKLKPEARLMPVVEKVALQAAQMEHVEDVEYGRDWLKNFLTLIRVFEVVGIVVGILVLAAAVFIISNTIKITVYSRRDEISIMKLVGARDLYIRIPFMLEGMLQGLLASALAVFLLWSLFRAFLPFFSLPGFFMGENGLVFLSPGLVLAVIAGGAALGIIGSAVSFSEFLNV